MDSIKKYCTWLALSVLVVYNLLAPFTYAVDDDTVSTSSTFTFTMPDWVVSLFAESEPNEYKISFHGNWNTNTGVEMQDQDMVYDVPQFLHANEYEKTGYHFLGWNTNSWATTSSYNDKASVNKLVYEWVLDLYAIWEANTNTNYTVEHYQQNAEDNEYTPVVADTEILQGTTDTPTVATAKNYEGFTAQKFDQVNIDGDGNAVVTIYYDRNDYTITFNSDWGSDVSPVNARYGKNITSQRPANPSKVGYAFQDWNPSYPETMPLEGSALTAVWLANTDTAYRVDHYVEAFDGTYSLRESDNLNGTTAEDTNAVAKPYEWFTPKTFAQQKIKGDGSTVVNIEYTRNSYTVGYVSDGVEVSSWDFKYEQTIPRPEISKAWYTFNGWSWATTMPAENTILEAQWTANTNTQYTVKHLLQNIEDNNYTEDTVARETKTGTTDTPTAATVKNYSWFTAQAVSQVNIDGDGQAIVEIKYTRNSYTITFHTDAGSNVWPITAKYGATITTPNAPIKRGYQFDHWSPALPVTMPAENMDLYAVWAPREDTTYYVEHYLADLDWNYPSTPAYKDKKYGTTEQQTQAEVRTVEGYTASWFNQETISGDETTVVRIYYTRNLYTITYDGNGGSNPDAIQLKFGASIPKDKVTTRVGYTFVEWLGADTVPANNVTLVAQWTPNTNTKYTVRHLWQNTADNWYSQQETEELYGTTDSRAIVTFKDYDGFKTPIYENKKIAANGSTVIDVKYDRQEYTISFNSDGGSSVNSIVARYGASLTQPTNPSLEGYVFSGWIPEFSTTMPLNGASLTAEWRPSPNTPYTVEHYLQNLDNEDEYTLKDTDNLKGTTLENTEAEAKNYSGFTAPETIAQETILANGTTKVKIYYTRNSYEVIPVKWAGIESIDGAGFYKYQSVANLTAHAKEGYAFSDSTTTKVFSIDVPAYPVRVTLNAIANTYTISYNEGEGSGEMNTQTFTYDQTGVLAANSFSRSGYVFSGWIDTNGIRYEDKQEVINVIPSWIIVFTAEWKESAYVYFMDGDTIIARLELAIGDDIQFPMDPTKAGYEFDGWDGIPEDGKVTAEGLSLTARWKASDVAPHAWGGGGRILPDDSEQEHGSAGTGEDGKNAGGLTWDVSGKSWTGDKSGIGSWDKKTDRNNKEGVKRAYGNEEVIDAYNWAYAHDITTLSPLDDARPDGWLYRGHLAKMVVNYALNVLGWQLPAEIPKDCKWWDSESARESEEIRDYAIKSCALGLMGIDMNYFYPNLTVSRAQFGTILSRLLYGKKYAGGTPYYKKHLNALKENWVMTQIDNPETRIELRERVWVMLMRSAIAPKN